MRELLAIVGPAGGGKSTLLAATLAAGVEPAGDVPYVLYPSGLVQLGAVAGRGYPGADVIGPHTGAALAWLCSDAAPARLVVEGVHLAHYDALRRLAGCGWRVHAVYLDTPDTLARARRLARGKAEHVGEAWYTATAAAARELAETLVPLRWRLDGRQRPAQLAARLRRHPVLAAPA